jgi:hypothetical protein
MQKRRLVKSILVEYYEEESSDSSDTRVRKTTLETKYFKTLKPVVVSSVEYIV